jgi:PKD repeat protein
VSGCVAAVINNHTGTIGAAPGCRVLSAKFTVSNVPCDGGGTFQFSWLVSALNWGQLQGARISSNSNGLPVSSSVTAKYQQTYTAGMVHFASAGNDGTESIGYPASLPEVNAISAINRTGAKASFSSYGSGLSLAAPGQSIYTTDRSGSAGYASGNETTVDGTSFSAPYAAAVAALLLSVDPWLTAPEVENQLHTTAMDLGAPGFDNYYGYGLVNALGAIAHARFDVSADLTLGPAPLTVNFTGSTARLATSWEWNFGDGETATDQNPIHNYAQPGYYTVATTVQTAERPITKSVPGMISAYADTLEIGNTRLHGSSCFLEVYARNYLPLSKIEIPFVYQGDIDFTFDSVETSGLRSDFMIGSITGYSTLEKRAVVQLSTSTQQYLQPGAGPVARLWFTLLQPGASGHVPVVVGYPDRNLNFTTYAGNYQPMSRDGFIEASCCKDIVGDANGDGQFEPTISDIQWIVTHLFINGVPLECYPEADANQSGGVNPTSKDITISDIARLVDHLFITRAFLQECL